MKKLISLILLLFIANSAFAAEEEQIIKLRDINSRINKIGTEILNSNRLEKRVIFTYSEEEKLEILKNAATLKKRQVVVYADAYNNIDNDDELAGYIAREIPLAIRSYDGIGNGWLSAVKMKAAPKKYEIICDKLAVDYMVKAGYNPLGLITFINKAYPQVRQDRISMRNLTSKRLAYIYERIYNKYPEFLVNNTYLDNKYYQNFLLTSLTNRLLVEAKAKNPRYAKDLKYE